MLVKVKILVEISSVVGGVGEVRHHRGLLLGRTVMMKGRWTFVGFSCGEVEDEDRESEIGVCCCEMERGLFLLVNVVDVGLSVPLIKLKKICVCEEFCGRFLSSFNLGF